MSRSFTLREHARYRFDDWMSRGAVAQMGILALLSAGMVLFTAVVLWATSLVPVTPGDEPESFAQTLWRSAMRAMDAGTVGGDNGPWTFLFVELAVTLGGIFVLSALIGVLNGAIEGVLEGLRKGRSLVVEREHTVVLGWAPMVHRLLSELAEANSNRPGACVAILADRDKVEMDDEIREQLAKRLRVVTRSGSPLSPDDLALVNLDDARSVIVVSPPGVDAHEADVAVLKTLLAIGRTEAWRAGRMHLVAEIREKKTADVARMVLGERAALVLSPPLVSRLLVQTGRQSGLSAVVTELLDFAGCEIYECECKELVGTTFADALLRFDRSALIGVVTPEGAVLVPPPFDRPFAPGDKAIAISEDDDTVVVDAQGRPDAAAMAELTPTHGPARERTLVLGAGPGLPLVLSELDPYVGEGSETLVVGEAAGVDLGGPFPHMTVRYETGDPSDRDVLDRLDVTSFDHILVLSETEGRTEDMADARTMIALLHLRDIMRKTGRDVPVTTEMLDLRNQELATVADVDDFIVSNTLVSLMMSQVSENPHLVAVFDELFSPGGYEIYLKPAGEYVRPDADVDFHTVVGAAVRRQEVAIGYRLAAKAREPGYGVVIDPRKADRLRLGPDDKVIVLAQE